MKKTLSTLAIAILSTLLSGAACAYEDIGIEELLKVLENDKNAVVVDVRTPEEYSSFRIENSLNIPLDKLAGNLSKLSGKNPVVVCRTGNKSREASIALENLNFNKVRNVRTGMPGITRFMAENEEKNPKVAAKLRKLMGNSSPIAGFLAPEFELKNVRDKQNLIGLKKFLGEKVIVLLFWMPGDARNEAVFEQARDMARGEDGAKFIPVFRGNEDDIEKANAFFEKINYTSMALADPDAAASKKYWVRGLPWLALIDKDGVLRANGVPVATEKLVYLWDNSFSNLFSMVVKGKAVPYPESDMYGNRRTPEMLAGKTAPDFALPDGLGRMVGLSSYKGKNHVLLFWILGCPYCREEVVLLNDFHKAHGKNIPVLSVVGGPPEQRKAIEDFLKQSSVAFPVLYDETGEVSGKYFISGVPVWLLIDKTGKVRKAMVGMDNNTTGIILNEF